MDILHSNIDLTCQSMSNWVSTGNYFKGIFFNEVIIFNYGQKYGQKLTVYIPRKTFYMCCFKQKRNMMIYKKVLLILEIWVRSHDICRRKNIYNMFRYIRHFKESFSQNLAKTDRIGQIGHRLPHLGFATFFYWFYVG